MGFPPTRQNRTEEEDGPPLERRGTWHHKVTIDMLEKMCDSLKLEKERARPALPGGTDRLRVLADWDDPRVEQLRRWCGHMNPDHSLEFTGNWTEWLTGEDVPWEVEVAYERSWGKSA